jgi:hypothetical protein
MEHTTNLDHYKNKNILLFVAGKQDAVLLHFRDGKTEELLKIEIPRPKYSDNEAIFGGMTQGRNVSGSVELRRDEIVIGELVHELKAKIKDIKAEFDEIYYFAPSMSRNLIKESLPKTWQDKITKEKQGNYFHESTHKLLEIIDKETEGEEHFDAETNEEAKILSVPKQ